MNNPIHPHMYIHTYMKKRIREEKIDSKTTNFVAYNKNNLDRLQEICLREKTNVSSVLSNFIDVIVNHYDGEKPNTLDDYFLDPDFVVTPDLLDVSKHLPFLIKQNSELLRELETAMHRNYVYCVSFQQMSQEEREQNQYNFPYLVRKYTR